ncbi:MAG: hypothetical protein AB9869_22975 [Verrucomicrobiia bacterium]
MNKTTPLAGALPLLLTACAFIASAIPPVMTLAGSVLFSSLLLAAPIRLHPDNPRWFEWRGKATALVTSAEHYGAVVNPDFDFQRYLEAMQRDGMNYTRFFSGTYVEPTGAFGIARNTLAPAPGRFLAPWARSHQPGYAGGGHKFDLDHFSPEYLARLKAFIGAAGQHGIVVELTLFCSTYTDQQWAVHPLNPTNNIQAIPVSNWKALHTTAVEPAIAERQEKLARWLVRELKLFDNVIFEIQNEPWFDNHTMGDFINPYMVEHHKWPNAVEITTAASVAWQRRIAQAITDEERTLPHRHLIAQNIANFRLPLMDEELVPEASILNFHYAYPEVVDWNRGLKRVIGYDETGFSGEDDATYRRQAWSFILSGGGLFNSLDYSFTVGREDGTDVENKAPGGGSPKLRRQLKVLSDFIHRFDLATMNPNPLLVERAPGVVTRVLSARNGRTHALYIQGRAPTALELNLAKGRWTAEWISVEDGAVLRHQTLKGGNAATVLPSPEFTDAVALRLVRE